MHMCYMGVSWVCVYVCLHVHISMYHLCGGIDSWVEVRVRICFTFVFHRYFIMDSWRLACVCVYVCAHVHIYVYCLCGRVEG